jgi:hypothetical protein
VLLVALSWTGCSRTELGLVEFEPAPEPFEGETPEAFGAWTSFDVAPAGSGDGVPRITMSYYDRVRGGVGWAVGTPGEAGIEWVHELVDGYVGENGLDSGDRGKYSAQRTMPDGTVWVAYHDSSAGELRARHRLGPGVWEESASIDGPGTGAWASMAVDGDGHPLIVHCTADGRVRETRGDGAGGWSSKNLYQSGKVEHTQVVVADGKEYVVFHDADRGELHLLVDGRDDVVDDAAGAWPNLVLDGSARWIAYQDVEAQDLRLAHFVGGAWDLDTVDAGELRGADTAVHLGADGPEVLYFDGFDNDLRVARRSGGSWRSDRLAGEGVAAGFFNRVVEVGDETWWFSYDYTHDVMLDGKL